MHLISCLHYILTHQAWNGQITLYSFVQVIYLSSRSEKKTNPFQKVNNGFQGWDFSIDRKRFSKTFSCNACKFRSWKIWYPRDLFNANNLRVHQHLVQICLRHIFASIMPGRSRPKACSWICAQWLIQRLPKFKSTSLGKSLLCWKNSPGIPSIWYKAPILAFCWLHYCNEKLLPSALFYVFMCILSRPPDPAARVSCQRYLLVMHME